MSDRYAEIEYKWDADHAGVHAPDFNRVCMAWGPIKYTSTKVPDVYYVNGKDVVRHRWRGAGAGELTVKQRKGRRQIVDRVEVDLTFSNDMRIADVQEFLRATGFKRTLTLFKDHCHVFWFDDDGVEVVVAYYGVERLNERTRQVDGLRHFIEVEVSKDSKLDDAKARALLEAWRRRMQTAFLGLGHPIQFSLYELYTGKQYTTAKKRK